MLRSPKAKIEHGRFFMRGEAFSLDYGLSMGDLFCHHTLLPCATLRLVRPFVKKLISPFQPLMLA